MNDLVHHGRVGPQRFAKAALKQQRTDPPEVLDIDRLIKTERHFEVGAGLLAGADVILRQHQVDDVAGNHADGQKNDETREDKRRDQCENAADDIALHDRSVSVSMHEGASRHNQQPAMQYHPSQQRAGTARDSAGR